MTGSAAAAANAAPAMALFSRETSSIMAEAVSKSLVPGFTTIFRCSRPASAAILDPAPEPAPEPSSNTLAPTGKSQFHPVA